MMSMMDEMQKTLARRREKTESESPSRASPAAKSGAAAAGTAGNSQNRKSGSESPKMPDAGSGARRRLGSVPDGSAVNGDAGGGATTEQMEVLKQEILREMRKEVDQMKKDIIEAIRTEMRR